MQGKVKVVLYIAAEKTGCAMYGENGRIRHELAENTNAELDFVSFSGEYLMGEKRTSFLVACSNADIVITDAWHHHAKNMLCSVEERQEDMARLVYEVRCSNSNAKIFSQLMEERYRVAVHKLATPFCRPAENQIIQAIKSILDRSK